MEENGKSEEENGQYEGEMGQSEVRNVVSTSIEQIWIKFIYLLMVYRRS